MAIQSLKIGKPESSGESLGKKATNWLFFWLVGGIMIAKDLIDLALSGLEAVTTATVLGIPIAIMCMIIGAIMTITVAIIAMIYHIYTREGLLTKFVITSITTLIGMIPILSVVPDAFGGFLAACFGGIAVKVVGKIASSVTGKLAA